MTLPVEEAILRLERLVHEEEVRLNDLEQTRDIVGEARSVLSRCGSEGINLSEETRGLDFALDVQIMQLREVIAFTKKQISALKQQA